MAVRLDDKLLGDLAGLSILAEECGLADCDHAIGKLTRLYDVCTKTQHYTVGLAVVRSCLGANGIEALVYAGYGELVPAPMPTRWAKRVLTGRGGEQFMRIRGTEGRIEWYGANSTSAPNGGRAAQEKRKQRDETPAHGLADGAAEVPAQAPADTPAEVQRSYLSPLSSDLSPQSSNLGALGSGMQGGKPPRVPRPRKAKAPEVALPADWQPRPQDSATAEPGVNVARELANFRDHAAAKGRTQVDWDAAWRMWLRKAAELRGAARGGAYQTDPTAIAMSELERLRAEERSRS